MSSAEVVMPRTLHLLGLGEKLAASAAHLPDGDFGPWAEIERRSRRRSSRQVRTTPTSASTPAT
jgi:hypothetical protein